MINFDSIIKVKQLNEFNIKNLNKFKSNDERYYQCLNLLIDVLLKIQ